MGMRQSQEARRITSRSCGGNQIGSLGVSFKWCNSIPVGAFLAGVCDAMTIRTIGLLLGRLAGLFLCLFPLSAAPKPLWSLDLSASAEYQSAASHSVQQERRIVILDDNCVLILSSFLHKDSSTALLTLVDGSTGLIAKSLSLGDFRGRMIAGSGYDIARLGGNRFLLAIGDELRLGISPELRWVRSRTSPPRAKGTPPGDMGGSRLYVSPSGKAVFLQQYRPGVSKWVDPDSLATRYAASSQVMSVVGLTDREFVGNIRLRGGDAPAARAAYQLFGEPSARPLCNHCKARAIFGHDWIALDDSFHVSIADHEGHVRYRDPRELDPSSVAFAGSAGSDRIAFTYLDLKRERDMYLVDERVAVVDVSKNRDVFNMSLDMVRKSFPMRFGLPKFELLLSPDGRRLAVLHGTVMSYFALN